MKYRYIIILTLLMTMTVGLSARKHGSRHAAPDSSQVIRNYMDSLAALRKQLDALQLENSALKQESADGRYLRLFAPATFYHSGAHKMLTLAPTQGDVTADAIDDALMHLYLKRPDLIRFDETALRASGGLREDVNQELTQQVELTELAAPMPEEYDITPVALVIKKPNFWKFKGDGYLQFLQNYVSPNWHKGGESNYSAVAAVTLEMNYNDKDRITFDNKLEMKLGIQTSPSDTIHKFKTNNDLLRLTSKLGLQAHKRWYYTLQLLAYTQFARGLKANDVTTYSDFMSPFDLNLGLGMEYKMEAFNKRLTGTLNFLPLSFNFRYVDRKALTERNGIVGDHHTMEDFGSQFTGEVKWQLAEQVSWKSRLFAYTSYHRGLIEWENLVELKVTKYLTANLFVYPRFDDSSVYDDNTGYWQFQEWSSIGLSYSF